MKPYVIHVCGVRTFKVGDPCPEGYLDRSAWADVHMKAKIKQAYCGECSRWRFVTEPPCCEPARPPSKTKKGRAKRG